MAENQESAEEARTALARRIETGEMTMIEGGRQMVDLDPEFGSSWFVYAQGLYDEGRIEEAEEATWKGIERAPSSYRGYHMLADLVRLKDPDSAAVPRLKALGFKKVSYYEEVPETVLRSHETSGDESPLDFEDPYTFLLLALANEDKAKEGVMLPEMAARLRPYELIDELQESGIGDFEEGLIGRLRESSEACVPLLRSFMREWTQKAPNITDQAGWFAIALLGELGGPEVLDQLLRWLDIAEQSSFNHVHWAVWRLGQRFPAETLDAIRRAAPEARLSQKCAFAEQLGLMPASEAVVAAMMALLDGFAEEAGKEDAAYLLVFLVHKLNELGRNDLSAQIRDANAPLFAEEPRKFFNELADDPYFTARLLEKGIPGVTIQEVCVKLALIERDEESDELEEDEEFDEDEELDEDEEEEEYVPPVKPGRNDPCWCGSGRKYKKCHLEFDEAAKREKESGGGDGLHISIMRDLVEALQEWQTNADRDKASGLYFGQDPEDIEENDDAMVAFMEWLVFDYRLIGSGRTVIEEFLRRRPANLGERKRGLLRLWRELRLGLWEVMARRRGVGLEVKNYFTGERMFVNDEDGDDSVAIRDLLLNRIQHFEGRYEFASGGLRVPRRLRDRFIEEIETGRASTGESGAEYVASHSHLWWRTLERLIQA